ncbi:DUF397 domain-containing protein [Streptomyces sp. NPDC086519]|uniref:DUF397 domain-containing protein n=1 Tax=Streptomyces sp. NPDC086519 TaxID=3154863 RepID=UPI0034200F12
MWINSSYSQGGGIASNYPPAPTLALARDSNGPRRPKLVFRSATWSAFKEAVKIGCFPPRTEGAAHLPEPTATVSTSLVPVTAAQGERYAVGDIIRSAVWMTCT